MAGDLQNQKLEFWGQSTFREMPYSELMTLKECYELASTALDDSKIAERAVAYRLEKGDIRSFCEEFYFESLDNIGSWRPPPVLRIEIAPEFWLGSQIDWGESCATLAGDSPHLHEDMPADLFFEAKKVMVYRADVDKFWRTLAKSAQRKVSKAALVKYLLKIADGNKTENELRATASNHFDVKIVERLWRAAFADVPATKKIRGRPHKQKSDS